MTTAVHSLATLKLWLRDKKKVTVHDVPLAAGVNSAQAARWLHKAWLQRHITKREWNRAKGMWVYSA